MSSSDEKAQSPGASPPTGEHLHEHLHEHVHHGGAAADHANHPHEVVYADMTQQDRPRSYEKSSDFPAVEKASLATDEEMGNVDRSHDSNNPATPTGFIKTWYRKLRAPLHIFIWLVFTA